MTVEPPTREDRRVDLEGRAAPKSATPLSGIVWLSSAPTWKVIAGAPESSAMPLNFVSLPIVEISAQSWATSAVIAALSAVARVPLLNWTARSRTRWSIECTSASAPSPVCTSETRVLRVALGLVEAADLGAQLLADREAGGVVGGAVDPVARGEPLHRLRQLRRGADELTVGVERLDVVLDAKRHGFLFRGRFAAAPRRRPRLRRGVARVEDERGRHVAGRAARAPAILLVWPRTPST